RCLSTNTSSPAGRPGKAQTCRCCPDYLRIFPACAKFQLAWSESARARSMSKAQMPSPSQSIAIEFDKIRAAHEQIRAHIHRPPVLTSERLNEASRSSLFFKCENFQKIGAFKARGATNAVFALDDATARRGVATHSSGNHGTALARAAKLRGIPAHIVMPSNSAKVKVRAVESYGAQIVFCEPNQAAREAACADVTAQTGATM